MSVRTATEEDFEGLAATLTGAFEHDPLWRWAFPDLADLEVWWRFYIRSALRYPWVLVSGDYDAVASWIPPGGVEITEEEEAQVEGILTELVGDRAPDILELLDRFEAAHPHDPPHFYLSLLGTRPDQRGKGIGMDLLRESLKRIDDEGAPAYLESSNPVNDARYEGVGFRRVGEFTTPDDACTVGTMWRDAHYPARP